MVCPNCQSKDIVELQGQHFCINCGRIIELVTKKRGPGRPKADRLDKPKPVTLAVAGKAIADSIDAPLEIPDEVIVADAKAVGIKIKTDTKGAVTEEATDAADEALVEEAAPIAEGGSPLIIHGYKTPAKAAPLLSDIAKQAEVKARKRLQDIVPAGADDVEDETEVSEAPVESSVAAPSPKRAKLGLTTIISAAWSEPWQGGPARILAAAAIIAGTLSGGLTYAGLQSDQLTYEPTRLVGLGLIALGIAFMFGVANTERAATALRRYDHRPIPRTWLFGGALRVLGAQTLVLLGGIMDGAIVLAAAAMAGRFLPDMIEAPYASVAILAIFIALGLLLATVWAKTGLAAAGVELGQMKALEALKFGWSSLWRHPELVGTRLIAAIWLAASLAGIIGAAYGVHLYLPEYDQSLIATTTGILALTAVLLGNFGAVGWRQAAYREVVILDTPDDAVALLSGHHNGAPRPLAKYSFIIGVTALIGLGLAAVIASFYR